MAGIIVLDTSAILNFVKGSEQGLAIRTYLQSIDRVTFCIVTPVIAELNVFMESNNWGELRKQRVTRVINNCIVIDINSTNMDMLDAYKEIDLFSRGKKAVNGNIKTGGSIKMGKNDLWIAAAALVLNVPLITTDHDFNHLNNVMVNILLF